MSRKLTEGDAPDGATAVEPQDLGTGDQTAPATPGPADSGSVSHLTRQVMWDGRSVLVTDLRNADGLAYFIDLEPYGDPSLFEAFDVAQVKDDSDGTQPVFDLSFNGDWKRVPAFIEPYRIQPAG